MKCKELQHYLESWAPPEIQWSKDNTGLQVGNPEAETGDILICLEVTPEVMKEAISSNRKTIIAHHPFIFSPIKKINLANDTHSQLIAQLIQHKITLYSNHTNLDFTSHGVSEVLAKTLGLHSVTPLEPLSLTRKRISVFVPADATDAVADAMFRAGGGIIGEYTHCSYRTEGTGTFFGQEGSNPAIGERGKLERVPEVKIEMVCDSWKLKQVVAAMVAAHPYEEPAYFVSPTENHNHQYGMGAIGVLPEAMSADAFLQYCSGQLHCEGMRYSGLKPSVQRVAVCGGSGSDLIHAAIRKGADAFITADIKYHSFFEAGDSLLLIDAGHFETEAVILKEMQVRIQTFLKENGCTDSVALYEQTTSPIKFFYHS